jgi:uncharacterized DUF497 family protein
MNGMASIGITGTGTSARKHGVSIAEIESLFGGTVLVGPDVEHSIVERRYRAIGFTESGRTLLVVFTWRQRRNEQLVRPISARYMHTKEVEAHEKEISRLQDQR